jgi:immune inhibitor A
LIVRERINIKLYIIFYKYSNKGVLHACMRVGTMKLSQSIYKKSVIFTLLATVVLCCVVLPTCASPIYSKPFNLTQSDGNNVSVRLVGDEYARGYVTTDGGYAIKLGNDGYWYYVNNRTGNISTRVNQGKPASTDYQGLYLTPSELKTISKIKSLIIENAMPTDGDVKYPVILVNFPDRNTQVSKTDVENLLFNPSPPEDIAPYGSINDYYKNVSNEKVNVTGQVCDWIAATHESSYYNINNERELVLDAVTKADPQIDYSNYDSDGDGCVDCIIILYNGNSSLIWPHYESPATLLTTNYPFDDKNIKNYIIMPVLSDSANITTIGDLCHEIGHSFGLPDLYDTVHQEQAGCGIWDLMSYGCNNDYNNKGAGSCPAELSAWSKATLDFITPTQVTDSSTISIQKVENSINTTFQLLDNLGGYDFTQNLNPTGEYFLLENRRNESGFDRGLPGEGLLIWHIDESHPNNLNLPRLIDLEEANNVDDSNNNLVPWYTPYAPTFNALSSPNSNLNNGASSGVSITNISSVPSDPNIPMTANIGLPLSGYSSVRTHSILGSADGNLTDYQLKFVVHRGNGTDTSQDIYLNGGSQSWPNDVRFTNANNGILNYWIESNDSNNATMWVKVDSIAASPASTQINVYYGRTNDAGASNGPATFVFFDDFSGSSLNSSLWPQVTNVQASLSNGEVTLTGTTSGAGWISTATDNGGGTSTLYGFSTSVRFRMHASASQTEFEAGYRSNDNNNDTLFWGIYLSNNIAPRTRYLGTITSGGTINSAKSAYHVYEAERINASAAYFSLDDGTKTMITRTIPTANLPVCLAAWNRASGNIVADWVFVRKCTPNEPGQSANGLNIIVIQNTVQDTINTQTNNNTTNKRTFPTNNTTE